MRRGVIQLLELGQMPSEATADDATVSAFSDAVETLEPPASGEEASALAAILPETQDSLFGLAWTVLHFIESSPSWPNPRILSGSGAWIAVLRERAAR